MKVKSITQEIEEREILNLYRSLDSQTKKLFLNILQQLQLIDFTNKTIAPIGGVDHFDLNSHSKNCNVIILNNTTITGDFYIK